MSYVRVRICLLLLLSCDQLGLFLYQVSWTYYSEFASISSVGRVWGTMEMRFIFFGFLSWKLDKRFLSKPQWMGSVWFDECFGLAGCFGGSSNWRMLDGLFIMDTFLLLFFCSLLLLEVSLFYSWWNESGCIGWHSKAGLFTLTLQYATSTGGSRLYMHRLTKEPLHAHTS